MSIHFRLYNTCVLRYSVPQVGGAQLPEYVGYTAAIIERGGDNESAAGWYLCFILCKLLSICLPLTIGFWVISLNSFH